MHARRTLGFLAALVLLTSWTASAQRLQRHDGFWIGFGLGGGWNTSEGLDDARRGGFAGYFRLGGSPSQKVLLGGEAIAWGRSENGVAVSRGNATFSIMFFPSRNGGFFLKGGVGGANVTVAASGFGVTVTDSQQGFGSTFGLGFDVRLGRNIYLTPNVDFLFQAFDAGGGQTSTNTLTLINLGLTWH